MFSGIKLYATIAGALLVLGALWTIHHSIYAGGYADGEKAEQEVSGPKIAALTTDKANLTAAVTRATAETALAKAEAQQKLANAAEALKKAASEGAQAQAALAAWRKKFSAATTSSDCAAIAKAQLCSALSDY
jgi:hypothetical protein